MVLPRELKAAGCSVLLAVFTGDTNSLRREFFSVKHVYTPMKTNSFLKSYTKGIQNFESWKIDELHFSSYSSRDIF